MVSKGREESEESELPLLSNSTPAHKNRLAARELELVNHFGLRVHSAY